MLKKIHLLSFLGVIAILLPSKVWPDSHVNSYLLSAEQDINKQFPKKSVYIPRSGPGFFSDSELRYSDSNDNQKSLSLRVKPIFGGQRKSEKKLLGLYKLQQNYTFDSILNDDITQRYFHIITIMSQQIKSDYLNKRLHLKGSEISYFRSLAESETFNGKSLQVAELEKLNLSQQHRLTSLRLRAMLEDISTEGYNQNPEIPKGWMNLTLPVGDLIDLVNFNRETVPILTSVRNKVGMDISLEKLNVEKSSLRSWVNYFELKYSDKGGGVTETSFGLSVPLGRRKSGLLKRELEYENSKLEAYSAKRKMFLLFRDMHNELLWLGERHRTETSILQSLKERVTTLHSAGQAKLLLSLKNNILQKDYSIAQIHLQAMWQTIEILSLSGLLTKKPLRNWLYIGQPIIGGALK